MCVCVFSGDIRSSNVSLLGSFCVFGGYRSGLTQGPKGMSMDIGMGYRTTMVARNYVGPLQEASWFVMDCFFGVPRCYSRTEL